MVDMEIDKIDHRRKTKDGNTVNEYKATLKNETGDFKMKIKKYTEEGLERVLGTLKPGLTVHVDISNNQTKLTDHEGED